MNNMQVKGYNGNVNLKRKGTDVEFSQEMISEFLKCAKDPIYFSEKYIQIVHVDHGLIPIKMRFYCSQSILYCTRSSSSFCN